MNAVRTMLVPLTRVTLVCATVLAPAAGAGDVADVISDLYGGDGITLSEASGFGHNAHFTAASSTALDALNQGLISGLDVFSFNSAIGGFRFNPETGIPERVTDSLGPLLADSPRTIGKGKLDVGFSVAHTSYDRFQGRDLDELSIELAHVDVNRDGVLAPFRPFPGGPLLDFERDRVRADIELELEQTVVALFANYGLATNVDVGVVVPIVHARGEAIGRASIIDPTPLTPSPHFFDAASDQPVSVVKASDTGVGDVLFRVKFGNGRTRFEDWQWAIAGQLMLPTGDEDNLLGGGQSRVLVNGITSWRFGRFTPHLNIGYERVIGDNNLNNVRYLAGFDVTVTDTLTIAADIIGRWEPHGDGIGDRRNDAAIGAKWLLFDHYLLSFNLRTPIDRNEGLQDDFSWVAGFEYLF